MHPAFAGMSASVAVVGATMIVASPAAPLPQIFKSRAAESGAAMRCALLMGATAGSRSH